MTKTVSSFPVLQRRLSKLLAATSIVFSLAVNASEDLSEPPAIVDVEVQPAVNGKSGLLLNFNLASLLKFHYQKAVPDRGNGFRLASERGMALKVSASMPDETYRSLRAGGGSDAGVLTGNDLTEAFVFVQKRW